MVLFVWNVRELNGGKKRKVVLTLMEKFGLENVGLLDTRVRRRIGMVFQILWHGMRRLRTQFGSCGIWSSRRLRLFQLASK